jgi:ADP-ribosylglycohydrolase
LHTFRLKQLDEALSEQRNILSQVLSRLEKITPTDETDQAVVFASSIVEKARKRSERTEEDRKHAARLQMSKRKIANNLSANF